MLKVAVVGVGGWGKNHVRAMRLLSAEGLVEELYAVDIAEDRLKWAQRVYGAVPLRSIDEALKADVDAAVVATPTKLHHQHAAELASSGVAVLVEKPFAENYKLALEVRDRAKGVVATTGYLLRFHPAVRRLKEGAALLGKLASIYAKRTTPRPQRPGDVGVIKDLSIHDVDVALFALGARAKAVVAHGLLEGEYPVHAQVLALGDDVSMFFESSWAYSYKFRRFEAAGLEGAAVIDFSTDALYFYRKDSVLSPKTAGEEPLVAQDREFLKAAAGEGGLVVPFDDIIYTLKVCDAADISIRRRREVYLEELDNFI
ncbi:MAG: Gfo/Idh/MocA family protein [Thermoproteus sp. AZ2]|jgi:UDP-N-acetylglucosamine 3-dehydrogenase|uniref:Gfo/Idh/MocA family protein n=1 Tax=Thermoproteus sp. AZ2 TaxID=1609232 RepID=A0ACC6V2B0_9CREN|nr:MAG: oxidoreductase [Thermoproteus sp. AZ2]